MKRDVGFAHRVTAATALVTSHFLEIGGHRVAAFFRAYAA